MVAESQLPTKGGGIDLKVDRKVIVILLVSAGLVFSLLYFNLANIKCSNGVWVQSFWDTPCGNYTYIICGEQVTLDFAKDYIKEKRKNKGLTGDIFFEKTFYWCPEIKGWFGDG